MASITGGTVTYTQRVKTGDYEHKEAQVTLNFEGDLAASALEQARNHCQQGLGLVAPKPTLAERVAAAPAGARQQLEASVAATDPAKIETPKATKVTKAPKATKATPLTQDVLEDPAAIEGQVNGGQTRSIKELAEAAEKAEGPLAVVGDTGQKVDPASMTYPSDSRAAANADLMTGAVPASGIDRTAPAVSGDFGVEVSVTITDDILVKTVNAAIARGVNPENVRKLLPAYNATKLSLVPADRRADFVATVGKL